MSRPSWRAALAAFSLSAAVACSSGSSPGPTDHVVTISWAANHEVGVNQAGGGYRLSISGKPDVDVPYASGALAPTSKDVTLGSGTYTVTVTAYAALDAQGGNGGAVSAPSAAMTVVVP